jgi:hypothetical protein
MSEENFKIIMSCYDKTITVDRNYPDISIFDAIEDVVTCLTGLTFSKEQIIEGFSEYIKGKF